MEGGKETQNNVSCFHHLPSTGKGRKEKYQKGKDGKSLDSGPDRPKRRHSGHFSLPFRLLLQRALNWNGCEPNNSVLFPT